MIDEKPEDLLASLRISLWFFRLADATRAVEESKAVEDWQKVSQYAEQQAIIIDQSFQRGRGILGREGWGVLVQGSSSAPISGDCDLAQMLTDAAGRSSLLANELETASRNLINYRAAMSFVAQAEIHAKNAVEAEQQATASGASVGAVQPLLARAQRRPTVAGKAIGEAKAAVASCQSAVQRAVTASVQAQKAWRDSQAALDDDLTQVTARARQAAGAAEKYANDAGRAATDAQAHSTTAHNQAREAVDLAAREGARQRRIMAVGFTLLLLVAAAVLLLAVLPAQHEHAIAQALAASDPAKARLELDALRDLPFQSSTADLEDEIVYGELSAALEREDYPAALERLAALPAGYRDSKQLVDGNAGLQLYILVRNMEAWRQPVAEPRPALFLQNEWPFTPLIPYYKLGDSLPRALVGHDETSWDSTSQAAYSLDSRAWTAGAVTFSSDTKTYLLLYGKPVGGEMMWQYQVVGGRGGGGGPFSGTTDCVSARLTPDGSKAILFTSEDIAIVLNEASSGESSIANWDWPRSAIECALSADAEVAAIATGAKGHADTIELWQVDLSGGIREIYSSWKQQLSWSAEPEICGLVLSPDSSLLASAHKPAEGRSKITLWSVADGKPVRTWETDQTCLLAFSPDGAMLAGAGEEGAGLWQVSDGSLLSILTVPQELVSGIESLVFAPDGATIAAGGIEGVAVWGGRGQPTR